MSKMAGRNMDEVHLQEGDVPRMTLTQIPAIPLAVLALALAGCSPERGSQPVPADAAKQSSAAEKKSHAFRGKVEKVDPATSSVTVAGEDVPGWMSAMTMVYQVDKPEVLARIAAGDQITATVYDGDFATLHGVTVSPAPPSK
jgi:Cu/Ag efflux protein CusF